MFRFLALAWDNANEAAATMAAHLARHLAHDTAWTCASSCSGLRAFVAGAREGANRTYDLGAHGIVLGKLFRRGGPDQHFAEEATDIDDAERLAETGGRSLVQDYWGRYVAFLRSSSGTTVVRDPSGALPCFLMQHDGVHCIFSYLEDAIDLLPTFRRPTIRWSSIAAQMLLGDPCGRETALEGVSQVVAGEAVRLDQARAERTLVWNASDHARAVIADDLAGAASLLRKTTMQCAASWASCYPKVLLRLSGGVDSSILLACLAHPTTNADVVCLNYHSEGANSDERIYARLAASRFKRRLVERERRPVVRLDPVLGIARMPSPTSYVGRIGTARSDSEVAHAYGAPAMFTGGGGDQLFFELHHCWPAADYLRVRGLDAGFLHAAMDAARLGRVSFWKTLLFAAKDRLRSGPLPLEHAGDASLLNPEALVPDELASFEHPVIKLANDLPIGKLTQLRILLAHGGYYDPFERDHAPELVNPLLSQPLIELCLALPTFVLAHGGQGRALARQAFAPDLPREIATRRSKGGMSEMVKSLLLDNLDFARSMLLDGELVRRGLVLRHKAEAALSGGASGVGSNVMEIHDLIAIEAWTRRWMR